MLVQATLTTLFALLSVALPVTALATPRRIPDGMVARQPYNHFPSPALDNAFKPTAGKPVEVVERKRSERRRRSHKSRVRKRKSCAVGIAKSASTAVPSSTVMVSSTIDSVPTASSSAAVVESFAATQGNPSTLVVQNAPVITATSSSAVAVTASSTASASDSVVTASSTASATSSSAPAATSSGSTWTSVDTEGNGPFAGSATYYNLGTDGSAIGACGTSLVDSDLIAAASWDLYENWPGSNGNPNDNPICGQYAKVTYQGVSVTVRIADECPGCDKRHLDLSPSAFTILAPESVGEMDVSWEWVEGPNA